LVYQLRVILAVPRDCQVCCRTVPPLLAAFATVFAPFLFSGDECPKG
jgi:hypothetical protein